MERSSYLIVDGHSVIYSTEDNLIDASGREFEEKLRHHRRR